MPLISCSDCGRQISDQSAECVGCGRPTNTSANTTSGQGSMAGAGGTTSGSGQIAAVCTKCGIAALHPFWLLHENGTVTGTVQASTIGVSGTGLASSTTLGTTASASLLAQSVAPPRPRSASFFNAMLGGALVALATTTVVAWLSGPAAKELAILVWLAVGGIIFIVREHRVDRYNKQVHGPALLLWRRSGMCLSCGHRQEMRTVAAESATPGESA
jgi:hypothetical protein